MEPVKFWILAAGWGSYVRCGDPGACLYGFDERGAVQSEDHRSRCVAYLDNECRKAARFNEDPDAANDEIDDLIAYLETAPCLQGVAAEA